MIIWLAVAIPVIVGLVIYLHPWFHSKVVWWEITILCTTVVFIAAFKWSVEGVQTIDKEWWTVYLTSAHYWEPWTEEWDEWVPESGHTDSDGNYVVDEPAHWEHHVAHHPPSWTADDNMGSGCSISQSRYRQLVGMWGGETEEDLRRMNQTSSGDGDVWNTYYPQKFEVLVPYTNVHTYENRVQASTSLRKFREVANRDGYLHEYPESRDPFAVPSILGVAPGANQANVKLCKYNALYGNRSQGGKGDQVRMWILLYQNQPIQTALDQEQYWGGGNKNELVLCIGTDDKYRVQWAYCFSWTDVERLKIEVQEFARKQDQLDLDQIVDYMTERVSTTWVRKEFADFSYLTVEPPTWAVITTYIVTFLLCVGWAVYAVLNEFTLANPDGKSRFSFR